MKGKLPGITVLLLTALLFGQSARADDLAAQISRFIRVQLADSSIELKVQVRTPVGQWPQCEAPQLALPQHARRWGNLSVSVRCGQERRFIQVQVQAIGSYLVSTRGIEAGGKLTATDVTLKTGRLDTLPPRTLTQTRQAIGAISLRNIRPGQPLSQAMLRRDWVIKAGQPVRVIAQGDGFNISGTGKAMNNAAAEDSVRVRMVSGQIVSGIAHPNGTIRIAL